VNTGTAAIANDTATTPDAFYAGYNADLGTPAGARYAWSNVWRRDFAGGIVLVNEPYRTTRTLTIPDGYQDLDGVPRTSVTLAGGTGIVLVPTPPAPAPTPEPPAPTSTPVAPVAVTPPVATAPSSGSTKARVSAVGGGLRGARPADSTRLTVRGGSTRLS